MNVYINITYFVAYNNKKLLKLHFYVGKLWLITIGLFIYVQ